MNKIELIDAKNQLKEKAMRMIDTAKKEVRDLTPEEEGEINTIKEEIRKKDQELKNLEERLNNLSFDTEEEKRENKTSNIREYNMSKDKQFSLVSAIRKIVNNQPLSDLELSVINEGNNIASRSGINVQGQICLPTENRTISVKNSGDSLVQTDVEGILEPLYNMNTLLKCGSTLYSGLVGNVQIPSADQITAKFEGENDEAQTQDTTFKKITLTPKRVTAVVTISKSLLVQTSPQVDATLKQMIVESLNQAIEKKAFSSEDKTENSYEGIFHKIAPTPITNFKDLTEKEAGLDGKQTSGEFIYILSPKAKAGLRNMVKGKSTNLVYQNGEVDGVKSFCTGHVDGTNYVYLDPKALAVGTWGSVDLVIDPFTKSASSEIVLVCSCFVDFAILNDKLIATGTISE